MGGNKEASFEETRGCITHRYAGLSLRQIARQLGYPPGMAATLCRLLHRQYATISKARHNELRIRLGLRSLHRRRIAYTRPCLSRDPAQRLVQLQRLLASTQHELTVQVHK